MNNYFRPATELAAEVEQRNSVGDPAWASVYRKCAIFADQQYHAIVKSPDAIRWKIYMGRKRHEIKNRSDQMQSVAEGTLEYHRMKQEKKKAATLLRLPISMGSTTRLS